MAAILTVANIHFDTTATTRLEHLSNDGVVRINAKAFKVATGPDSYKPTNEEGLIRYNTDYGRFEFYDSTGWGTVSNASLSGIGSIGTGANAFASATIAGANSAVGSGANAFARATIAGANSAVGTGANTFLLATLTGSNTIARTAYDKANSANLLAYAALPQTGGTISGSLTVIGAVTVQSVSDSNGSMRIIPASATTTTLVKGDIGKYVPITSTIAIPANIFSAGDAVSIYNNSGTSQSITTSAVTCYLAGTATTTSPRTLAQRGVATILCVGVNTFVITGSGLT